MRLSHVTRLKKIGAWGESHISELNLSNFPKSTNNFPSNLIGNVELGQGHVRRAEKRILRNRHGEGRRPSFPRQNPIEHFESISSVDEPESIRVIVPD